MKKIYILFFISLLLFGCKKDETNDIPINTEDQNTVEEIFKATGCKPTNVQDINIARMKLFVDNNNIKYLYGSKIKNNIENFWIAKFDLSGDQLWEIINSKSLVTNFAYNPQVLSNGNLVLGCVKLSNNDILLSTPIEVQPVLITPQNGTAKFINVREKFQYSDITIFDNFFFCSIGDRELSLNPNAIKWFAQIDNKGNILKQNGEMNIPQDYSIWKDSNTFISLEKSTIEKNNVLTNSEEPIWAYNILLPSHLKCEPSAKFDKDTVIANYKLKLADETEKTYTYKLSYTTGKEYANNVLDMYTFLDLEKPYVAPDSMTVTLHSIKISNNNQGTMYYNISYTLQNKTKEKVITEGTFEALYSNLAKGAFQTGFFSTLYPGESINRTYTFKSISGTPYEIIQYKHNLTGSDADIIAKSLKWKINNKQ